MHPSPREMKDSTAQINALERARNSIPAGGGRLWLTNPHQPPPFVLQWWVSTSQWWCPFPPIPSVPRTPQHRIVIYELILSYKLPKSVFSSQIPHKKLSSPFPRKQLLHFSHAFVGVLSDVSRVALCLWFFICGAFCVDCSQLCVYLATAQFRGAR